MVKTPIHAKPGEVRCPRCLLRDIVASMPRGWKDAIMLGFGRVPRHCRSCGKRFYVPAAEAGEQGPDQDTPPAPEA